MGKLIKKAVLILVAVFLSASVSSAKQADTKELSKNIKIGDTVYFGRYEQDGNKSNGKERIEWQVLDKEGNKALLISKKVLDVKAYNKERVDITWEDSTIRKWLNKIFINAAFNGKDKNKIIMTTVENKDNKKYGTKGGNTTKDKVFLLSIEEEERCYKKYEEIANITEYALGEVKRIRLEKGYVKSEQEFNAWWEEHQSIYGWQWWYWLRSPGNSQSSAAYVGDLGYISEYGFNVNYGRNGVRPALWMVL